MNGGERLLGDVDLDGARRVIRPDMALRGNIMAFAEAGWEYGVYEPLPDQETGSAWR